MAPIPRHVIVRFAIFSAIFASLPFWRPEPLYIIAITLVFIGTASNAVVIAANGWRMPITAPEDVWAKMDQIGYVLLTETTKFPLLADRLILRLPQRRVVWYSIGDVVVYVGFLGIAISVVRLFIH